MKAPYTTLFFALVISFSSHAQWNPDTLVRNSISASGSPEGGVIMQHDPTGGLYVCYLMADFNGRSTIMAQRLDAGGNKLWNSAGKMIAPGSIGGYYTRHSLVASDSGSCLVIWRRAGDDLCAQRFDSNGDTLFTPYKKLYTPFSGTIYENPTLPDDSGGAIILFKEASTLKELRIDKYGNNLWPNPKTLIGSSFTGIEGIFPDRENGALYFYQPASPVHTCYVQHVGRNGVNLWSSPVTITTSGDFANYLTSGVAYDSFSGGCFFMYANTTNFFNYLQHVDTAGNLLWSGGGVPVRPAPYNEIVADGQGGVFHAYVILHAPDTNHTQIIIKHYDQNGTSLWNSPDTIVYEPSVTSYLHMGTEGYHRLVADNGGGAIITWNEMRDNRLCIYSQRYDASGNKVWRSIGFPVITANNQLGTNGCGIPCDNLNQKLIAFGDSSAVVSWHDTRHGNGNNPDVYVAKIDGLFTTGIDEDRYNQSMMQLFPNPAVSEINLEFGSHARRTVQVLDAFGKLIFETTVDDNNLTIPTQNFSSGIYFVTARKGNNWVVRKFAKM